MLLGSSTVVSVTAYLYTLSLEIAIPGVLVKALSSPFHSIVLDVGSTPVTVAFSTSTTPANSGSVEKSSSSAS